MKRKNTLEALLQFRSDKLPEINELDEEQARMPIATAAHDPRPMRFDMPHESKHKRALNQAYNSLMVNDYTRHIADFTVRGNQAINFAANNAINIALPNNPNFRLEQWPDSVQVYLAIRHFSLCPTVATGTGEFQCYYNSATAGTEIALGDFPANTGGNVFPNLVIPDGIGDPGNTKLGTLNINWLGGAAGVTVGYQIGFSAVYLLHATAQNESDYAVHH